MDALRTEIQQQLRQEFQVTIDALRSEILLLRSQTQPQARPKPSLPDPEKFNGQAHRFDTWLPSIKAKLRVDSLAIGDSVAQFYYVYLNIDSHVQAMVLPQLSQAEEAQQWDFTTILDQLTRVYDNPNKVQEAEDKLLTLKQGTDSLPTYVAKFERVLYEARGQSWPDVNKISAFRNGLSQTIRGRLAQQLNLPRTYPDFIRVVQQLSGRTTSSLAPSSSPSTTLQRPSQPPRNETRFEPMDMSTVDMGAFDFNTSDLACPRKTTILRRPTNTPPPDSPPSSPRARPISPQRRQEYRTQGRCVRCGSGMHWVKDCPLDPYSSVGTSGRKVMIAALDNKSRYDTDKSYN